MFMDTRSQNITMSGLMLHEKAKNFFIRSWRSKTVPQVADGCNNSKPITILVKKVVVGESENANEGSTKKWLKEKQSPILTK